MQKSLVAYFSASGVTGRVAKDLASLLGADIYEIRPKTPYSAADLNWQDATSRSSVEMHDLTSRPELLDTDAPVAASSQIFLGFPIWWYVAPTLINTFLEAYDFSNKRIILFATSGGSGFGKALQGLQTSAPNALFQEGRVFRGSVGKAELEAWVKTLS